MAVVYFVHGTKSDRIKIGRATDLRARLSALRSNSSEWIVLLGYVETDDEHRLERRLHEHFARLRGHGEWFESGDDLLRYIATRSDWRYDDGWEHTNLWYLITKMRDNWRRTVAESVDCAPDDPESIDALDAAYEAAVTKHPSIVADHDPSGWPTPSLELQSPLPEPEKTPIRRGRASLRSYKEARGLA